jgi:glycogen(starch) synthase
LRFAGPNEKIVFFIGRMVGEKGAHLLVEAVGKLHPSLPLKLVIAGGGARTHLEERAQALGIWDSVYFTGRISDDDRDGLYAVADVAVYPSLYEPFGIVALEAMAAGVPVVVSDAGGLREVVEHDVTGTTTYAGDVNSLAWGIDRVLRDDVRAAKLAERAKEVVRTKFSWNPISRATVEVYKNVLNA